MRNDVIIVRITSGGRRTGIDAPLLLTIPTASKSSSDILPALMAFCISLHESRYSSMSVPPPTGMI